MRRWVMGLVCVLALAALGAGPPQPEKTQTIIIKADGPLEIDYEKRTAAASRNVRLTTKDGMITADRMEFTFDEKFAILALTAAGNVRIKVKTVTQGKVERQIDARGDAATYRQSDRLLTLKGNVTGRIVEPARRRTLDLTSKVAMIWLEANRVRLEGATMTITQPKEAAKPAPAEQEP